MLDLAALSRAEQIGQFFFLGLPGPAFDDETRALLEDIRPGGVVVFARSAQNGAQLRQLLDDVRAALPVEPLIAIDQEGGLVDRLRRVVTPIPSARALREAGDIEHARTLARLTGQVLRLLGCNMNFAPVVDFLDDKRMHNNGLLTRVLGLSPESVANLAQNYLAALQAEGVLGCLKHFPGIGAGAVDPHEDLPVINLNRAEIEAQDLVPYKHLFANNLVSSVMIGHGYYPNLSPRNPPAPSTLDRYIVTDLLRGELGYRGLVVTDDLEMGAVTKHVGFEQGVVQSFQAGSDMILICATPDLMRRGYHAVTQAVERGEISGDRIRASLRNIAAVKAQAQPPAPFDAERLAEISAGIAALNQKLNYSYGR
jgi:beta-N-acetylhexosaminidase